MMKRLLILIVIALVLSSTAAFAAGGFAIGGEGSWYFAGTGGLPVGAMVTFKLPQLPLIWAVGVAFPLSVGITADYWIAHGNIVSIFDWYVGVGGYLSIDLSNPADIGVGARIPIALQIWPVGRTLEIFLEAAPAVGISFVPTGFGWHIQGALGLRFWL
jgi:hypothetical protein